MGKIMRCGILGAFLVNSMVWAYLWFVNNTGNNIASVSYTHMTLPTIRLV